MRKVCLRVNRRFGERLRRRLAEFQLLDADYSVLREGDLLLFPLRASIEDSQLEVLKAAIPGLELVVRELEPQRSKPKNLEEALRGCLPPECLDALPRSLDIIGDIAVVELPGELEPHAEEVGAAIMEVNRRVTAVYAKAGGVEGTYRIRPLRLIAGEQKTRTIHREYGIRLVVDVTRTYFSPRLSTEHDRVAKLVRPGETVVDLFTGVGPFALLAAKRHPVRVYAIDVNEYAIQCLKESLRLNRLQGRVFPLVGDCRSIVHDALRGVADRVIMNLPHDAIKYLDVAAEAISSGGGTVHFYAIENKELPLEVIKRRVTEELKRYGRPATVLASRRVRATAPHEFQVALDLQVAGAETRIAM